jgi:hypothetical protein
MEQYSKTNKSKFNKKLTTYLKSINKELDLFFDIKLIQPKIFFLESRKEIDRLQKRKTEDWMVGWADNKTIYILNPKTYAKESSHKNIGHFWQVLKHEFSHLYFKKITKNNRPKWLNEGLACYLANQNKKEPSKKIALKIFEYHDKSDWQVYQIGFFWVKLLIEKFGRPKIIKLIESINSKTTNKQFSANFYKIYKIRFSKKDFFKLLNK